MKHLLTALLLLATPASAQIDYHTVRLMVIAQWVAEEGMELYPVGTSPAEVSFGLPTTGTPVAWMDFNVRFRLPMDSLDPEVFGGTEYLRPWLVHDDADSTRVRLRGIDANENAGPWSEWSEPYWPAEGESNE